MFIRFLTETLVLSIDFIMFFRQLAYFSEMKENLFNIIKLGIILQLIWQYRLIGCFGAENWAKSAYAQSAASATSGAIRSIAFLPCSARVRQPLPRPMASRQAALNTSACPFARK
jgi:hypothetical protein